jgi:uncharacterized membrane protein YgaE (UPF0421/DUF939 family)
MSQNDVPRILAEVGVELRTAMHKYEPMHSAHEGYAVLLEEVDEVWEVVRQKDSLRNTKRLRAELIQVAAMAVRMIHDVCEGGE